MHFQVWNWLITERPKKALERITELADHYMLRDIHMSEYSVKNKNGITGIIIYIVNRILSADPELYYSQEMSELFRRYDGLKHIIDN
ncbi:MAG: hypothetical protein H6767_00360 [Candidatus Peribacteria bacterium]|nr:MAG: hypothetical protein H6767_00360 [Candidatus Peribacteria bacterium]